MFSLELFPTAAFFQKSMFNIFRYTILFLPHFFLFSQKKNKKKTVKHLPLIKLRTHTGNLDLLNRFNQTFCLVKLD